MAEEKVKHITVSEAASKDFERLAPSYQLYHKALLEIMIHYFIKDELVLITKKF